MKEKGFIRKVCIFWRKIDFILSGKRADTTVPLHHNTLTPALAQREREFGGWSFTVLSRVKKLGIRKKYTLAR